LVTTTSLKIELRREDPASFQNFLRIQPEMFDELLARVGPRITKHETNYRKALDPGTKLAATLRHLASGDAAAKIVMNSTENHLPYLATARTSWSPPAAAAPH